MASMNSIGRIDSGIATVGKTNIPIKLATTFWVKENEVRVRCISPDSTREIDFVFMFLSVEKVKEFAAGLFSQTAAHLSLPCKIHPKSVEIEKELLIGVVRLDFSAIEASNLFLDTCVDLLFKAFQLNINRDYENDKSSLVFSTRVGRMEEIAPYLTVKRIQEDNLEAQLKKSEEIPSFIVVSEGLIPEADPTSNPLPAEPIIEKFEEFSLF